MAAMAPAIWKRSAHTLLHPQAAAVQALPGGSTCQGLPRHIKAALTVCPFTAWRSQSCACAWSRHRCRHSSARVASAGTHTDTGGSTRHSKPQPRRLLHKMQSTAVSPDGACCPPAGLLYFDRAPRKKALCCPCFSAPVAQPSARHHVPLLLASLHPQHC